MNGLPPGLAGYVVAEQNAQQRGMGQIQQLGGLLGLQNAMFEQQLNPLKLQQLQMAVKRAELNNQLVQGIQGGGQPAPSPMAFGQGGISTPGGGQANLQTGQAIPAGQAPQGSPMGGIPPQVMGMLVSGDPGLMAVGKAILEGQKPVNVRPGGTVYIPGQGPQYTAPGTNGTQITYGPQGAQQSLIPGVIPNQAALGQTPGQWVTNADQTKSWIPTSQLTNAAMQNPIPQAPQLGAQPPQVMPQSMPQVGAQPPSSAASFAPVPPSVQAGRDVDRLAILREEKRQQTAAGRIDPALDREIAAEEKKQGGAAPVGAPIGGPPRFGQTQEEQIRQAGQTAEAKETGQALGRQFETVMGDAGKAAVSNRFLDVMEGMAKDFNPGKLAPMQNNLTQWAQSLGLPVSAEDRKAAGSIQGLTSMAIKMAGQATRQSDAQPSQLQYFKILESMPNAERTPEGFARIVGYLRDVNNINIIKAQEAQKWRQDHNGTLEGFEAQWPTVAKTLPFAWNTDKSIADARNAQGAQGGVRRYNPATGRIE